jgi:gamma-glutamylcysteine synthetase
MTKGNAGLGLELRQWYGRQFRQAKEARTIGLEKECPVVDARTYQAADARTFFPVLASLGWQLLYDDYYREEVLGASKDGVMITTDAGWCTLEIIMPPESSVLVALEKELEIEALVTGIAKAQGKLVLGYGIQPVTQEGPDNWINKRRHEVIRSGLLLGVDHVTVTAADQVHVSVSQEEMIMALNVFNALSGPIIFLFANSPVRWGQRDPKNRLAIREDLWEEVATEGTGMIPRPFADLEDFLQWMTSLRFCIAKQGDDYIIPGTSFGNFLGGNGHEDWQLHYYYHEASTWLDARLRARFGTIEVRQACSQSKGGIGLLAALVLGLASNLDGAQKLVARFNWPAWQKLKTDAIYGLSNPLLIQTARQMILVAEWGLQQCEPEAVFLLESLSERLANQNPALELVRSFQQGGLDAMIKQVIL